jgi:hypothetical protein
MEYAEAIDSMVAYEERRTAFFDLADRFLKSEDLADTMRLREELACVRLASNVLRS